jgi:hypothetical protein
MSFPDSENSLCAAVLIMRKKRMVVQWFVSCIRPNEEEIRREL